MFSTRPVGCLPVSQKRVPFGVTKAQQPRCIKLNAASGSGSGKGFYYCQLFMTQMIRYLLMCCNFHHSMQTQQKTMLCKTSWVPSAGSKTGKRTRISVELQQTRIVARIYYNNAHVFSTTGSRASQGPRSSQVLPGTSQRRWKLPRAMQRTTASLSLEWVSRLLSCSCARIAPAQELSQIC